MVLVIISKKGLCYGTALYEVERPVITWVLAVITWVLALGSYLRWKTRGFPERPKRVLSLRRARNEQSYSSIS